MGVEIRPAEPSDIEAVQGVARAAWHAAHEPIIGEDAVEEFLATHYDRESLESRLDAETVFLVATGPAVVGFAVAGPTDSDASTFVLGRIYVRPDRWGEGIGQQLLDAVEHRARQLGGERMRLGVMAENDRAVEFYETAGYDRVGEHADERIDTTTYEYETQL